jgi:phospholipid transport system substrate-binding protein
MTKFLNKCLLALTVLLSTYAYAQTPVEFVQKNTDVALSILNQNQSVDQMVKALEKATLTQFDFTRMTALAVGRPWQGATPEQKKALTDEFQTLLLSTYSTSLSNYKNAKISVNLVAEMRNNDKEALVKTKVTFGPKNTLALVDYALYRNADSWKAYNIFIEGSSLVTVYRNQFADEIKKSGIDGLIASLKKKNATKPK